MDGGQVADELKRHRPMLPILLYSGYSSCIPRRTMALVDGLVEKTDGVGALLRGLADVLGSKKRPSGTQVSLRRGKSRR
jgi:hypothetical protein